MATGVEGVASIYDSGWRIGIAPETFQMAQKGEVVETVRRICPVT